MFLLPITPVVLTPAVSLAAPAPAPVLVATAYDVIPPAAILSFIAASIGSSESSSPFPTTTLLFSLLRAGGLPLFALS